MNESLPKVSRTSTGADAYAKLLHFLSAFLQLHTVQICLIWRGESFF